VHDTLLQKSHFELCTDKGGKNTNITIALLPYLKINTEKKNNLLKHFQAADEPWSCFSPVRPTSRFTKQVDTWELFTLAKTPMQTFLWLVMLVFPPYSHIL